MGSPVDDALDRLTFAAREMPYAGITHYADDIATVRGELERLREERDGADREVEHLKRLWGTAEAENRRLTEGLREIYREATQHHQWWSQEKARALLAGSSADAARVPAGEPDEPMPEACPNCGCLTFKAVNTSLHLDAPDGAVLCDNCGKGWVHSVNEYGLIEPDEGGEA